MTCVWDGDMHNKCQKMHGMFMTKNMKNNTDMRTHAIHNQIKKILYVTKKFYGNILTSL